MTVDLKMFLHASNEVERMPLTPYQSLMAALLNLAIADGDLDWINQEQDWIFSFASCCEGLGIDPAGARERLNRDPRMQEREKEPRRAVPRAWVKRTLVVVDLPGRSYDHEYKTCVQPSRCKQCRQRYTRAHHDMRAAEKVA